MAKAPNSNVCAQTFLRQGNVTQTRRRMTARQVIAMAVMALADVSARCPHDLEWAAAHKYMQGVLKKMQEETAMLDDRETSYRNALQLVAQIDRDIQQGTRHYRDRSGRLLLDLGEVVDAILRDELVQGGNGHVST